MIDEYNQHRSPINDIPIEILSEIFSRCVDHSSAHVLMQPNTEIAPMLLCQVCATWRMVALSIPLLWSHLRFELPLNWHSNGRPFTWDQKLFAHRLEWLRWWRRNLGSMAPYLQVELWRRDGPKYRRGRLSEPTCQFLLDLMSSAQYLSVGLLYQYLVQRHTEAGYVVKIHPNAHTIVCSWSHTSEFNAPRTRNQYLISVITQTRSTLRYLAIEYVRLPPRDLKDPLNNWSTLTHLSMRMALMSLNTWFSFIRSLSALQSGCFTFSSAIRDNNVYTRPTVCTLPCLLVLHVGAAPPSEDPGQLPLKAVFDNLRLPVLRTLSLASRTTPWYNFTATHDIHAALLSAPALTKLSLGTFFLRFPMTNGGPEYLGPQAIINGIEPLATYGPRLEHLSFVLHSPLRENGAFDFVTRTFSSSRWLDLKNPSSTVREITLVLSGTPPDDLVAELVDRSLLISEIRKFVKDEVIIGFEDEEPVEVQRAVWGW